MYARPMRVACIMYVCMYACMYVNMYLATAGNMYKYDNKSIGAASGFRFLESVNFLRGAGFPNSRSECNISIY